MAKKTKKVVPTKEDIQRKAMIKEYNRNNTDTQILLRKVQEDDIKALEDELKAMQDRQSAMTYLIADKANAKRVCEFLLDWNDNRFIWTKDMWKGVIQFNLYLQDWIAKFNGEQDLVFDFPALSYSYNMLMNPAGVGLDAAKFMSSVDEQYNAVLDTIGKYIDEFTEDNKKFKILQDCLAARYQGFMMIPGWEVADDSSEDCLDTTANTDTETTTN